jgi:hypothetical protein
LTPHAKNLGIRCNEYLRRHLPADAPVKRLAVILDQSRQTAARLFAGDPPTTAQLAALAAHFGKSFLAHVFEPAVGRMDDLTIGATLTRVEALLLSLHPVGARLPLIPAPQDAPTPVSQRLPLSEIASHPMLVRALESYRQRSGRLELAEAVALARADGEGRTSITSQRKGDVLRFAYRGRAVRIHAPADDVRDMPVAAMADAAYAHAIQRSSLETARSSEPVLAHHRSLVRRSDGVTVLTDVIALQTVDRAADGTMVFTSTVTPAHAT